MTYPWTAARRLALREQEQRERYAQVMGRQPPADKPEDEPFAWQWSYGGTKAERERLAIRLGSRPTA